MQPSRLPCLLRLYILTRRRRIIRDNLQTLISRKLRMRSVWLWMESVCFRHRRRKGLLQTSVYCHLEMQLLFPMSSSEQRHHREPWTIPTIGVRMASSTVLIQMQTGIMSWQSKRCCRAEEWPLGMNVFWIPRLPMRLQRQRRYRGNRLTRKWFKRLHLGTAKIYQKSTWVRQRSWRRFR